MPRSQERKDFVRDRLNERDAIVRTGRNREGEGTRATNPITIYPASGVVETYLGPAGTHTPLEALMHQAELVADVFDRLGYDTTDVETIYDLMYALVKRNR